MKQRKEDTLTFPNVNFLSSWLRYVRTGAITVEINLSIRRLLNLIYIEISIGQMTMKDLGTSREEIIFLHQVSRQDDADNCWNEVHVHYYPNSLKATSA